MAWAMAKLKHTRAGQVRQCSSQPVFPSAKRNDPRYKVVAPGEPMIEEIEKEAKKFAQDRGAAIRQ
jgi:hypothetical protein